jgi:GLPGLI family protein
MKLNNIKSGVLIFFVLYHFSANYLIAQSKQILTCGEIIFEKKESTLRKLKENRDEDDGFWMDEMIKNSPKFTTNTFYLKFKDLESEYNYFNDSKEIKQTGWGGNEIASKNHVYKNYATLESTTMKQVFENDFIFQDSVRQFNWKLTTEYREIAGYDCRKATTIINDSVYVIAFYTDDIVTPSGPESFGGLPGTILGLVIPRTYTTWFATEVKNNCPLSKPISKPLKGKKSSQLEVEKQLKDRFGKYKKWYQGLVWKMLV